MVNADTFRLTDGREVRLAGVVAPSQAVETRPDDIAAAMSALRTLVAGRPVTLFRLGPDADRYDRIVAHVMVDGKSVQGSLLAQGLAQVSSRIEDKACARDFLAREKAAREAKLGLWADPYYAVKRADDPAAILAAAGQFAIVEGRVLSVRESGGTIYVNFGRRWTRDFAVTIAKRNERNFAAAGLEPKKMEGRQVRVRGWIEQRGGPRLAANGPEQIEINAQN